ncbi:deoxynucleotidyltransferase terminal-interacting protein 2 [Nilaparvata lugens]|uniref:deoxynucleotidyltransferase terminal-interacting protein 2 n=1 Tax=Nilaparvata lugens TaxID=108931 RepID=UPI00193DDF2C|nr:deoxynucleotidyltransferase terminal-interacting protein 2 [Nilaparvata lugens]
MTKDGNLFSLDNTYLDMNKPYHQSQVSSVQKILKKSILNSDYEMLERDPECEASIKQQKIQKLREKKSTKGPDWFNMKNSKMTREVQNDLRVLHMRQVLDPKHFYKKNDIKGLPKYFQVGKYVDSPTDFYSARLSKKERKNTIVEELMADAEFMKFNKKKHKERKIKHIKTHAKAHQKAKRLKKKNKK